MLGMEQVLRLKDGEQLVGTSRGGITVDRRAVMELRQREWIEDMVEDMVEDVD